MSCGCNGYCNNQDCSGHIAPCSNTYSFSSVSIGTTIDDNHLDQIRAATDQSYSRRGLGLPSWPNYPVVGGDIITAARYTTAKNNINALNNRVTSVFTAGNIIYASQTVELQNDCNYTRNYCICNYNCTCNINCSCNVNCVCDYP